MADGEHVALGGQVPCRCGQLGGIGVQRLVAVHGNAAVLVQEMQRFHRPAGEVVGTVFIRTGEVAHIRPAAGPVGAQRHKGIRRDAAVPGLVVQNVLDSDRVVRILLDLGSDVDDAQRIHHAVDTVLFRQGGIPHKMTGKVDVCAELTRELEGLDQAIEHLIAPVVNRFGQLHRSGGDAAPDRAVVVQRMGQIDPCIVGRAQLVQNPPKMILCHVKPSIFPEIS